MKTTALILLISIVQTAYGQSVCDSLTALKKSIYGFKPTELNDTLQKLKSADLDKFWDYARQNKDRSIPCLKKLITEETNDGFFCFDASSLLIRLDEKKQHHETVIAGLKKCETEEVQLSSFLKIILALSAEGNDVSELAAKYLSSPTGYVYLTDHFLNLNRTYAGVLIYGSMDDNLASKSLAKNLTMELPEYAKHSSAILLHFQNTDFGNRVLDSLKKLNLIADSTLKAIDENSKSFSEIPARQKKTYDRKEVLKKISWVPFNFEKKWYGASGDTLLLYSAYLTLGKDDLPAIRAARKRSIYSASDEALYEYFALTKLLFVIKQKNE